ncbi:MAG TPA: nitrile hydratase accessory protein [Afifellaceae bacterium]|nr:nitrile hydratase accessory protein [Afifellaceae bacterium]
MKPPEGAALAAVPSIPRDDDGPVFPAPWAATAFAMTLALHERGLFTWAEWAERLGAAIAAKGPAADPENYWLCWLAALETTIESIDPGSEVGLQRLREAWRQAAHDTPHGEPIELGGRVKATISR